MKSYLSQKPLIFFDFRLSVKFGVGRRNATIEIPVIYKISHQDYQPSPKYFNDIGLLKLASYALNKEYIKSLDGRNNLDKK